MFATKDQVDHFKKRYHDWKKENQDDIDPLLVDILEKINSWPGFATTASCEGHMRLNGDVKTYSHFYILMAVALENLPILIYLQGYVLDKLVAHEEAVEKDILEGNHSENSIRWMRKDISPPTMFRLDFRAGEVFLFDDFFRQQNRFHFNSVAIKALTGHEGRKRSFFKIFNEAVDTVDQLVHQNYFVEIK